MQAYNYQVQYRPSADHASADALSRLSYDKEPLPEETELFFVSDLDQSPVDASDISGGITRDPVLSRLWSTPSQDGQTMELMRNSNLILSVELSLQQTKDASCVLSFQPH